ncbi:hypothetical protein TNIN_82801 [Trichonephila inaurata madagascariensis]|uniref:Uncharacterized protein n=1 Tax=Trichonephila inaurata madagascariensis TaxID=2747483 RepID=A0A8X6Y1D9_9ARAC|nr:hypothetical protein TNIN_82801 [Trichonephila inaurata madagascariensis]
MGVILKFCSNSKCLIFLFFLLNLTVETSSLKCYECFWSQKSIDESEYESKFQNRKSLKYPMVEGPVISSDEPPSTPEEMKECSRKECPDSRWCMKWSYISKGRQLEISLFLVFCF